MPSSGGRIISAPSITEENPAVGSSPTSVTRAAGMALTQVLSKEFASRGVLVNAVCADLIRSGQHDDRWERSGDGMLDDLYAAESARRSIPLRRSSEVDEVADVNALFASERASYVPGTAINVDGAARCPT